MSLRYFLLPCFIGMILLALPTASRAQSFNIDLDVSGGPPEAGHGAPSSTFGAAAGQQGFWHAFGVADSGPRPLRDISGQLTGVLLSAPGIGTGGGSNDPINTGNYALLLNDYTNIPNQVTYSFTGIRHGSYRVYTYAAAATHTIAPVHVSVNGSISGTQIVTGPPPGNAFQYLVTHSIHEVPHLTGDLQINLSGAWPNATVTGFQIVAVPEPGTMMCIAAGFALLFGKRRKRV